MPYSFGNELPWGAAPYSIKRHGVLLTNCDSEPVQTPGCIQANGAMIVFDPESLIITQTSSNTNAYLGATPEMLLNKPVSELLGRDAAQRLADFLQREPIAENPLFFERLSTSHGSAALDVTVHTADGAGILEFEPSTSAALAPDYYTIAKKSLARLQNSRNVKDFCHIACVEVRQLTGMDRVMAYCFHEDGSGEVIAESRREDLPSWLGLRYPAEDIPQPAREIFSKLWVRPLPDVNADVVEMTPLANPVTGRPLNMTYCALRGASVMYREYLQNMQVGASLTLSIRHERELWGLLAAHHQTPIAMPWQVRATSELLAQTISLQLPHVELREHRQYRVAMQTAHLSMLARLAKQGDLSGLTDGHPGLLDGIHCAGVAVLHRGAWSVAGETPPVTVLQSIADWVKPTLLRQPETKRLYTTDRLAEVCAPAAAHAATTSGLLAVALAHDATSMIFWLRPEIVQTVSWAGNPHDSPKIAGPNGLRLSPRRSFELWQETVAGRAQKFARPECEAAIYIRGLISDLVMHQADQLSQLNAELTSSNEELDSFAYVASHDLKEPIRGIHRHATLLQGELAANESVSDAVRERLQGVLRLSVRMDGLLDALLHFSRVGRLELQMHRENLDDVVREAIEMLGPPSTEYSTRINVPRPLLHVFIDRVRVREIFTNFISNGLKYNRQHERCIEIGYLLPDEHPPAVMPGDRPLAATDEIIFYVRDNGIGIAEKHCELIFDMFKRLHARDSFGGGSGAGLTIARRLIERHDGVVWVESEVGTGTTFYFTLHGAGRFA